jgi:hypothetical protein
LVLGHCRFWAKKQTAIPLILAALMLVARPCLADDALPPQLDSAIDRGLVFLAKQQRADGSFDGGGPRVAMTALGMMAFMASGHTPDVGKYGLNVRRAVDFLVKEVPADGYIGKVDGSRMYGHGIVTLALAEALGVETTEANRVKIRAALDRMVQVILKAQDVKKDENSAGGWRYEPGSADSDLSLSGWNALALRAAQNAGVAVPKERVERAVGFVLKCYKAKEKGFAYQPGHGPSVAMTGVGVLNLYLLDAASRPEVVAGAEYLLKHPVNEKTQFPYYSLYYATQAAHQAGEPTWSPVWKVTLDQLLAQQVKQDGGWPQSKAGNEPGRVYATSMALLTLSVPYRLLPIYQR